MAVIIDEEGVERDTVKRPVPEVVECTNEVLADEELFPEDGTINCDLLLDFFKREGRLTEEQVLRIIRAATQIWTTEPNVLRVEVPAVICGDIHGQFFDLCKLLEVSGGTPKDVRYVFLGDYVDRGYYSIECFLYLAACKVNWPEQLTMLRGNHECRHLTSHFTFKGEVEYKYSRRVYEGCGAAFDALPLAAIVNRQLFCVHGGISPDLKLLSDLDKVDRFRETPNSGLMCDLLWTDPHQDYENDRGTFSHNSARGCSYRYSFKAVVEFLKRNGLLAVVRGHEAQATGYRLYRKWDDTDFPSLITIFSAPNYAGVYNNQAAVLKYDGETMNIRQFNSIPHPFQLPKFMNAFDWSFPFVGEKVAEMLMAILELPALSADISGLTPEEIRELEDTERMELEAEARAQLEIAEKIQSLEAVSEAFVNERKETEALSEFGLPGQTILLPANELAVGEEEIKAEIEGFKMAKLVDQGNERLPDDGDADSVCSEGAEIQYPPPEISDILSEISEKATSPVIAALNQSSSISTDSERDFSSTK